MRLAEISSFLHYSPLGPKLEKKRTHLFDFKNHIDQFYKNINTKIICEFKQRKEILASDKGGHKIDVEKKETALLQLSKLNCSQD